MRVKDWFRVAHLMLVSKKGMSALQIYRSVGFGSYKTARLMRHTFRTAVVEDVRQLAGIVEMEKLFLGGDKIAVLAGRFGGRVKSHSPLAAAVGARQRPTGGM